MGYQDKKIENFDIVNIKGGEKQNLEINLRDDFFITSESPVITKESNTEGKINNLTVKELVWRTVQTLMARSSVQIFSPKDIIDEIHKKHPEANTIRCQITSDCVNHSSRHYYSGGQDRYWRLARGKFRLYDLQIDPKNEDI